MKKTKGALRLTKKGLIRRDELVIQSCIGLHIPLVIVMAGGYALDTRDTAEIHTNTCVIAIQSLKGLNKKLVGRGK